MSDPICCSTAGFSVLHHLLELAQTYVHWVGDANQPSHLLSSPSSPAFNLSPHQGLFQWVSSLPQVAKVLELQLQHQSFQWIFRLISLRLTGLISLQSKGLSRVFFNTVLQKHQLFGAQLSLSEKEMATHSSVLAWRIPGTGEPGGLPSMGSHRIGHDWSDLAAAAAFFIVQLSRPYMTTGQTIALTRQIFIGKVMSLLFNMLYRHPSLWSTFHICTWLLEKPYLWLYAPLLTKSCLCFLISTLEGREEAEEQRKLFKLKLSSCLKIILSYFIKSIDKTSRDTSWNLRFLATHTKDASTISCCKRYSPWHSWPSLWLSWWRIRPQCGRAGFDP